MAKWVRKIPNRGRPRGRPSARRPCRARSSVGTAAACRTMEVHMMRRFVLASIAAASLAGAATVVSAVMTPADAQVTVTFGSPPPPLRYEAVPAPRGGYVWAPGHWRLVRDQYVWFPGQWYTARQGYRYVPETW